MKQIALTIVGGGDEEGVLTPKKSAPSQKMNGKGVKTPSSSAAVPSTPKEMEVCSSHRTRSQLEVSLSEGITKKKKLVALQPSRIQKSKGEISHELTFRTSMFLLVPLA